MKSASRSNSLSDDRSLAAPKEIVDLVRRFEDHAASYTSNTYNETQLRREFVDPFFRALGWDVDNSEGLAEAYKDVVHEDGVRVGGVLKAPDYSFRVGGTRKFFLETKRPSINLKDAPDPAFQLRRYGWSAKLPLSILTDFEELAVYDCRVRPNQGDKASTARLSYFTFRDYESRWGEIAGIFSKEAVLKGSFDKYAEQKVGKRGTATVDDAFLEQIDEWRKDLAQNLALRNPGLNQKQLNYAVQVTLDRIVFLRICEARGIEDYQKLLASTNGANVYARLCDTFRQADERYNSGLFHFKKERERPADSDSLTLSLTIDDKVLQEIVEGLYYPKSPYEFSVLPADILGSVYERFLGKVIRLTDGHRAKVEDKPEVKKAGGVFYTPTYIVERIVKETVGKLLEGKSPKQVSLLRILDPACGSGSFLIGAYQHLLDWHLAWYVKDGADKWAGGKAPTVYLSKQDRWCLTTSERKKILLNNIYGVDIDAQAVEVTKLSLLLKVLEGETGDTLANQLRLFHERALPDLEGNIKCGNSLIASDFHRGGQALLFDDEERFRINAFDWAEEFRGVFAQKGFDAVIGNPPYGAELSAEEEGYLVTAYEPAAKLLDSYGFFMVKAHELLKAGGLFSFIVPNTFCDLEIGEAFRRWMLGKMALTRIWQTGFAFKKAVVDTLVFVCQKAEPSAGAQVQVENGSKLYERDLSSFLGAELAKIDYRNSVQDREFLARILEGSVLLGSLARVSAGVKMYEKGKGVPPQSAQTLKERPYSCEGERPRGWRDLYRGEDVVRYGLGRAKEFVKYGPWLAAPRAPELFESPKILMRRTDDRLMACIDEDSAICVNSCHVIKIGDPGLQNGYAYLLALLNSSLMQRVFEIQNPQMLGKTFAEIKVIYVERLPIRLLDLKRTDQKKLYERIEASAKRRLELERSQSSALSDQEKAVRDREIRAEEVLINGLVCEVYGLSADEQAQLEPKKEGVGIL